jgi:diguanylate cyclase (GGDEF)-like protein
MNRLAYPHYKISSYIIVAITCILYVTVFAVYHDYAQVGISSLAVIPVIAGSWYFGIGGGILVAIFSIIANVVLLTATGRPQDISFLNLSNDLRMFALILVAVIIGRLGTVTRERREALTRLEKYEKERQTRISFLEVLNEITKTALEARDLESTLRVLVENIGKLFDADDCFLALWDEANEKPIPFVAHGSMQDMYPHLAFEAGEHTLAASLMKAGHPLAIPDLKNSSYISPEIASLFPSRAVLGLPLIVQDRKLATLYLSYNESHDFDQKEINQAEITAQQIALVLIKTQVLEEAQKQVKQLTVLHEVALVSTQVETIDQLIERVTEIIGKNLFPDNFGLLLMQEEQGVLHPHPSYRFGSAKDRFPNEITLGQGISGQVAQTGQPIRIGNVRGIQNYLDVDQRTSSELCVPIKLKDRVLGVINAESSKTNAFSMDDELLLGTLAGQLATAIEQLRTGEAERRWLDQLAHSNELIYALAHITTHIEKALSQEEIIQTLGEELNKIELTCIMAVYDKDRSLFTINYTSIETKTLEQMENGIGFPLIKHFFSLDKFNLALKIDDTVRAAVVANPEDEFQILFTRRREKGISEILQGIGIWPETEPLRLPLLFEEKLLGILWVWGKNFTRVDLPIMSIFAKQIGISLERARLFQEVQSLALTDPLTGLQNRRSLFELGRIEFSRAQRMKRPFCCMMLDLDHFKLINDNYGHPVGDQVLQQFAKRCQSSVREVDLIGRYGGEELVILLPETDSETAILVAERLRASVEETPMKVSGQELNVTVSIGISRKDENTLELETLIARADQAMYIAKHKGRNRVAISI